MKRLLTVLLFIFLTTALLPTLLSTSLGKEYILQPIASRIVGAPVRAESLSLGWFTSEVSSLSVEGDRQLTIGKLVVHLSPIRSLLHLGLRGGVYATDFAIKSEAIGTVTGQFAMERGEGILQLHTAGKTTFGAASGEFDVTLSLPPLYSLKALQSVLESGSGWALKASIKSLPLALVDPGLDFCSIQLEDLMGPVLDLDGGVEEGAFTLSLKSEAIEGSFSGTWRDEKLTLASASQLRYQMPERAKALLKESRELPILTTPVNLVVEPGSVPKLQLSTDEVILGQGLKIRKTRGFFSLNQELSLLTLDLSSTIDDSGAQGQIVSQVNFEPFNREWSVKLSGSKIPTTILDDLIGSDDAAIDVWMLSTIGPSINFSMELYRDEGITAMRGTIESERFTTGLIEFRFDKELYRLARPVTLKLNAALPADPSSEMHLKSIDLLVQLQRLTYTPRKGCSLLKFQPDQVGVALVVSSKEALFAHVPRWENLTLSNNLLEISGNSLSELTVKLLSKAHLEEEIQFTLDANSGFTSEWILTLPKLEIKGEGRHFNLHLLGSEDSRQQLDLSGNCNLLLTEMSIEKLLGKPKGRVSLLNPSIVQGVIDHAKIPLGSWRDAEAKGRFLIDQLSVGDTKEIAALKKMSLEWQIDPKNHLLLGELQGITAGGEKEGELTASVKVESREWTVDGKFSATDFPLALLEVFTDQPALFSLLPASLKSSITLHREGSSDPLLIAGEATGDGLSFDGSFIAAEEISLKEASELTLTITPERFSLARTLLRPLDGSRINLESPLTLHAKLNELSIPIRSPRSSSFSIEIKSDSTYAALTNMKDAVQIEELFLTATTKEFFKEVDAKLSAKGSTDIPFQAELSGSLRDLLTASGDWNKSTASLFLKGSSRETPIIVLAELFFLDPRLIDQIDSLLGTRLSSELSADLNQMTGPVKLELMGTDGWIRMKGNVQASILTLTDPLTAEFTASPRMSASVLDELLPLLRTAEKGTQPIRLEIAPQGFSYAIWGDPMRDLTIELLKLDLGKITFRNQEQIQEILQLLHATNEPEYTTVWFTPLYASYQGGVATLRRIDMLVAESYPIALWGQVDFAGDHVNMTVGLGGRTLRRAFSLKGIPDDYYLQIALKGKTDDARIDIKSSATRVAAFVAQFRSGPQGILLGAFLDIINTTLGQKKTPKPTTYPFPWDR